MNRSMITLNLRRAWLPSLPLAVALAAWVLVAAEPLGPLEPVAIALSAALGLSLAWRLFRDPLGEQAFLYSRALPRDAIFWSRWSLGLALLAAVVGICALIILLGLRIAAHPRSVFYPMIWLQELRVLGSVAVPALLTYQFTLLLLIRERMAPGRTSGMRASETVLFALMAIFVMKIVIGRSNPSYVVPYLILSHDVFLMLVYQLVVLAVTTAAALRCHRVMEIE